MTTPIHFEPTDPPELPIVPVDRETFDLIITKHGLTHEHDAAQHLVYAVLNFDGQAIEFVAPSLDVA